MAKSDRKTIDMILVLLGSALVVVLLVAGSLGWWAASFAKSTVRTELADQKIYFPPMGSPALASPDIGPYLNQYASQQLLTGPQAKAYADHFIAVHLKELANGQTYSQVSAASIADPGNAMLKQKAQTLFQGQTLRGLLLGDGYAYWTFGQIAQYAALTAYAGAIVMFVLVLLGLQHMSGLNRRR
jgi:hypothetical protein